MFWVAAAQNRCRVVLVDGSEAVLKGVQRRAHACKIVLGNRHERVRPEDIALIDVSPLASWRPASSSPSEACWIRAQPWPKEDLPEWAEPSQPTSFLTVVPDPAAIHPSMLTPAE